MKDIARHYKHHLKSQHNKILGVEVQYTNEPAHEQKAALVQLSVGKTQPVLLFQVSAPKDKCTTFDNFLLVPRKHQFAREKS
ncbi:hypothetical protein ZWY2020_052137 [Hordeum vulgare]|nr:hypothetical protein ZWY2020_052137 [Hordeum vulgare]